MNEELIIELLSRITTALEKLAACVDDANNFNTNGRG